MNNRIAVAMGLVAFFVLLPIGRAEDDLAAKCSALDVLPAPEGRKQAVIDHEKPDRYAKLPPSAGTAKLIRRRAKGLTGKSAEATLRRIHAHIADRFPNVPVRSWPEKHDDFDRLATGFDHRDCARHALVFANLARACGIPVVYVKSTRHTWIREFVATGKTGGFAGHVFLEVHVDGKWKLLDAQGMRIWDEYDPADPELPGGLLAWEKGWDHVAMLHSTQKERYKADAVRRWKGFDVGKLRKNTAAGRPLWPGVWACTQGDEWNALGLRLRLRKSFNRYAWDQFRPDFEGGVLIVTAIGGAPGLPPEKASEWLPVKVEALKKEATRGETGVHVGTTKGGTRVIVLSAPGRNEVNALIWKTPLHELIAGLAD